MCSCVQFYTFVYDNNKIYIVYVLPRAAGDIKVQSNFKIGDLQIIF